MTDKLLAAYEEQITELTLIPSHEGRFEVTVNDTLLFSKAALKRHAKPEEVLEAVKSGQPITV